jgi:hypothetical protein
MVIGDRRSGIVQVRSFFVGYHLRKILMPKTFRRSVIGDIIPLLVRRLFSSFLPSTDEDGSSMIFFLWNLSRNRLPSVDAYEYRGSTTLVSRAFSVTYNPSRCQTSQAFGEEFRLSIPQVNVSPF